MILIFFVSSNYCGNPSFYNIPENQEEFQNNKALFYGIFNFDDIFYSILTCIVFLGVSGWSSIHDVVKPFKNFNKLPLIFINSNSFGKAPIKFSLHFIRFRLFS